MHPGKLRLDDLAVESFQTSPEGADAPGTVLANAAAALLTAGRTCQGATCEGQTCAYRTCAGPSCENTFCHASCGDTCAFTCPTDITCDLSCNAVTCPSGGGWVCCAIEEPVNTIADVA